MPVGHWRIRRIKLSESSRHGCGVKRKACRSPAVFGPIFASQTLIYRMTIFVTYGCLQGLPSFAKSNSMWHADFHNDLGSDLGRLGGKVACRYQKFGIARRLLWLLHETAADVRQSRHPLCASTEPLFISNHVTEIQGPFVLVNECTKDMALCFKV
jgi:hypothetical protein